jgi:PAS domain S-box-containing protein
MAFVLPHSLSSSQLKVLLIEDNLNEAELIEELLLEVSLERVKTPSSNQFLCYHVERLASAQKILETEKFDVILLDLSLPDSEGIDTLTRLLSYQSHIPIVVLTANKSKALAVQLIQAGAQDYLVKQRLESELLIRSLRYAIERHHQQEALKTSEEKYRSVINNIKEVVFQINSQDTWTFLNPAWEEITGFSVAETLGQPVLTYIHPEDQALYRHSISITSSAQSILQQKYEIRLKDSQGQYHWIEVRERLSMTDQGVISERTGTLNDITVQKQSTLALRQSEARLRGYFDNSLVGIAIFSPSQSLEDLPHQNWLEINEALCHLLGYTRCELLQKTWLELIHPEDRKTHLEQLQQIFTGTCHHYVLDKRLIRQDGSIIHTRLSVSNIEDQTNLSKHLIAVFLDISDRCQSEQQLKASQEFLNHILNAIPDPVFVKDDHHRFVTLNEAFCQFIGRSRSELLGKSDHDFFPKAEADIFWQRDEEVLQTGQENENEENFTDAAGHLKTISTKKTVFDNNNGHKLLVGTIRDITPYKSLLNEFQHRENRLRRQQTALLQLATSQELYSGDFHTALQQITQTAAITLNVERVSIWFYDEAHSHIHCADLYQLAENAHSAGVELGVSDFPNYFHALDTEPVITADCARQDPRTCEFRDFYLIPLGITSMLDVPIRAQDITVGVICCEHIGPERTWSLEEQNFTSYLAYIVSLATESRDHAIAETALRQSEQRYELATRAAKVGVWEWNLKTGEFYLDPNIKAILGYENAEIPNNLEQWVNYVHPDDRAQVMAAAQAHLDGISPEYVCEHRMIHKDGSTRWILVRGMVMRDEAGTPLYLVGTDTDITSLKQAQIALQESQAQLQRLAANVPGMIHQLQMTPEGEISLPFVSSGCREIYEVEPSVLEQDASLMIIGVHPEDRAGVQASVATSATTLQPWRYEWRQIMPSGKIKWLQGRSRPQKQANGNLVWDGVVVDITDLKQAEAQLRQSEATNRALLDAIPDMMFRCSSDGTFLDFKPAKHISTLVPSRVFIGKKVTDILPASIANQLLLAYQQSLQTQQTQIVEYQLPDAGQLRDYEARIVTCGEDEILALVRDITERKRAEEELAERARQSVLRSEVSLAMTTASNLCTMLQRSCEAVVEHLDAVFARVWVFNAIDHVLELKASAGQYTHLNGPHSRVPVGHLKIGRIAQQRQPLITNDVQNDPHIGDPDWAQRENLVAFAGYPLMIENRLLGVLALFSRHLLTPHHLDALQSVVGQISLGIERKQASVALSVSEERLQLALEASGLGLWDMDVITQECYFDAQWKRMLGYEIDEIENNYQAFEQLIYPADRGLVQAAYADHFQGITPIFEAEFRMQAKSGDWKWILSRGKITQYSEAGTPRRMTGTHKDFTERKHAQLELSRFQAAVECASDAIVMANRLGCSIYHNTAFIERYGYTVEALNAAGGLLTQYVSANVATEVLNAIQNGLSWTGEVELKTQQGEVVLTLLRADCICDNTGTQIGLLGVMTDITERKQAEAALRQSQRRYQTLAEASPVCIFHADAQGRWSYVNQRWTEVLGWGVDNAYGYGWTQYLHPDDRELVLMLWADSIQAQTPFKAEYRFVRTDGEVVWVIGQAIAEIDDAGEINGYVGTITDIQEIKQAEEKLQLYQEIFLRANDAISILDADGFFLEQNAAYCALFGYTHADLEGQQFHQILGDGDAGILSVHDFDQIVQSLEQTGKFRGELRSRTKEGNFVTTDMSAFSVLNEAGDILCHVGILRDITERKQAEEERQKFVSLIENSSDFISMADLEGHGLFLNEAGRQLVGLDSTQGVLSTELFDYFPPAKHEEFREVILAAVVAQGQWQGETQLQHFQTQQPIDVWLNLFLVKHPTNNAPLCFAAVVRDISERIQSERALQQSEQRIRELFRRERLVSIIAQRVRSSLNLHQTLTTAVSEVRQLLDTDRTVVYQFHSDQVGSIVVESVAEPWMPLLNLEIKDDCFNRTYSPLYLQGRIRAINDIYQSDLQLCHVQLLEQFQVKANLVVPIIIGEEQEPAKTAYCDPTVFPQSREENSPSSSHKLLWGLLVVHQCRGSRIWTEFEIELLKQLSVQLAIAIGQSTLFEQAQRAREEALEASRMKSLFLANMSHEIRTPMNGVLGMTELLLNTPLNAEQLDFIQTLKVSGQTLLALINDILDFSKLEAGEMQLETLDFEVRSCVEEVLDLLTPQAHNKGLELAGIVDSTVPLHIKGDPARLRQVLTNLVGNGLKFTDKGEVVINVTLQADEPGRNYIRFAITDTGIGIAKAALKKLFQSFSQVDASTTRKYGGTGLGLAICKQLVELMGGEIGVKSTVGVGSTFWFTIPATPAAFSNTTNSTQEFLHTSLSGVKLMVISQKATLQKVVRSLVTPWGMEVSEIDDLGRGIKLVQSSIRQNKPYTIVLIDLQLSELTNLMLERMITSEPAFKETPWILLTTVQQREEAKNLVRRGLAGYITKPIKASQLFDCFMNTLHQSENYSSTSVKVNRFLMPASTQKSSLKILLVEDTPINQKVCLKQLDLLGYQADCVKNGQEAINHLATTDYDLILMDCQMPVMDGYKTTQQLRRLYGSRHIIIAMTANALVGEREKCLAAGMNDYISKPVQLKQLQTILTHWSEQIQSTQAGLSEKVAAINETSPNPPQDYPQPEPQNEPVQNIENTPTSVIDLERLTQITRGDTEFQQELLQAFVDDAQIYIKEARQALNNQDYEILARRAHQIKGGSATVAILKMPEIALQLETQAHEKQLENAESMLLELEGILTQVQDFISQ